MPDINIKRRDPVVINSEEGILLEKPSTPTPPIFTKVNHFQVMTSMKSSKVVKDHQAVLLPVRGSFLKEPKRSVTKDHMAVFLRTQPTTAIPSSPYLLRSLYNPLPDISRQRILDKEESALLRAAMDSSPPPTYQDTVQSSSRKVDYKGIVSRMDTEAIDARLQATTEAQKLFARVKSEGIKGFLEAGILKPAVESLRIDNATLQYETLLVITNLASGTSEDIKTVVESGAVESLIGLLSSPDSKVQEQSLWTLCNITADSKDHMEYVVQRGLLTPLLKILNEEHPVPFSRNSAWMLTNLTGHKPLDHNSKELNLILKAIKVLLEISDDEVQSDCLRALIYFTDGTNETIQMVIDEGFVPKVIQFMASDTDRIRHTAVGVCGNIATGTDAQTDSVLEAGALPITKKIFNLNTKLKKELVWFISNITAGSKENVQRVVDAQILPLLVNATKGEPFEVVSEAISALSNFTMLCHKPFIEEFIKAEGIPALLSALNKREYSEVWPIAMEGISNVLKTYRNTQELDRVKEILKVNLGLDILKNFSSSKNPEVSRAAQGILNDYFRDSSPGKD